MTVATSNVFGRLRDRTLAVYGYGNTGQALVRELAGVVEELTVYDDDPSNLTATEEVSGSVDWIAEPEALKGRPDYLVASPGISGDHPILSEAREAGVPVWDEIEFSYRLVDEGTFWAVTGTNGKSTCTELAGRILAREHGEESVRVCGNRGSPLIENLDPTGEHRHYVVEVSSFQIEGFVDFAPDGALLTTLGDDHREYHDSLEAYHDLKLSLLDRVKQDGPVVVPARQADREDLPSGANRRLFDNERVEGVPVEVTSGDTLRYGDETVSLEGLSPFLKLFRENVLGVGALLYDRVTPESIRAGLEEFEGLDFRAEEATIGEGSRVINDSKSTNPGAAKKLIERLDADLHVVLGGGAKNTNYKNLVEELDADTVKRRVLAGDGSTVGKLRERFEERGMAYEHYDDWETAVKETVRSTDGSETVVLSPGGTSFDAFENYRDRGRSFDRWIEEVHREN